MEKDFASWLPVKQKIDARETRPLFREREIWWCHAGINVGYEQDEKGKSALRPVFILRKFNTKIFFGFALSSNIKEDNPYYLTIDFLGTKSSLILNQARTMDSRRLVDRIGKLSENKCEAIKCILILVKEDPQVTYVKYGIMLALTLIICKYFINCIHKTSKSSQGFSPIGRWAIS